MMKKTCLGPESILSQTQRPSNIPLYFFVGEFLARMDLRMASCIVKNVNWLFTAREACNMHYIKKNPSCFV